jgi:thioredoxin-dependent peroxiredoxin
MRDMRLTTARVAGRFVMKCVIAAAVTVASLVPATPAVAALAVGDTAPDFSTRGAQAGTIMTVKLSELLKKGPVVLYFFPSAFTDTAESRDFAAHFEKFRAAGVSVVGMSRDSIDTLVRYSAEACAGKFPVASADESLVNAFDVNDGAMFNTRTTYVIAPSGKIAFVHDDEDPTYHAPRALAFVQRMKP